MKGLLLGIALIILVGIGGLIYRNAVSHPVPLTGACTTDAKTCPDGSSVGRVAPACNFAQCPSPNVTLDTVGIIFDLPGGFASTTLPDADAIAAYSLANPNISTSASTSQPDEIVINDYPIPSGEQASDVMQATAIDDVSGAPESPSAFSALTLGGTTYTLVELGHYNGTVHVAYYLPNGNNVLRFDSLDQNVGDWSDPNLDLTTLPTNEALQTMLTTLQTNQ
jgi:hypothetical protein